MAPKWQTEMGLRCSYTSHNTKKMALMSYTKSEGKDNPAHPRSHIKVLSVDLILGS